MAGTSSESNSSQRPEILRDSDSYNSGEFVVPGAYPEDLDVVDETTRQQVPKDENSTSQNVPQTTDALGTQTDSEPTWLAKVLPDVPVSEPFENMKISGEPTTLPSTLQDEYYRSEKAREMNVHDERRHPEKSGSPKNGYAPSEPVDRGFGEGVAVGYGGVTYHRSGYGGVLPGYPTQEGMSKLIFDRLRDDQLRLAGVDKPTSASMPAAISRSTNSSEGYPTNLPTKSAKNRQDMRESGEEGERRRGGRDVPCQERRETPIFEDGSLSGQGNFEAVHEPVTADQSKHEGQNPNTSSAIHVAIPRSTYDSGTSHTSTARSLPAESTKNNLAMRGDKSKGERAIHSREQRVSDSAMCVPSSVRDGLVGYLGKPISAKEQDRY